MIAPNPSETLARIALALERIADAMTAQSAAPAPADPAPDTPQPDTTNEKWITVPEVADRYGISEPLIHGLLLKGKGGTLVYKRNAGEFGRTLIEESSLPPLPEGPLCTLEYARQITGLNADQLRRRMHAGRINGYRPFGIPQYRFPRASLLELAAEEARRAI